MPIKLVKPKTFNPDLIQAGDCMGEIRVDATLLNSIDEGIARRGGMAVSDVRQCQVSALVDTGAVRSCIPSEIAEQLGIAITDRTIATYADGRSEVVGVTEPIRFHIMGRSTSEPALVLGDEVLIGQLILEGTDLWADCRGRRLVPNPDHPNQPVFPVK